MRRLCERLAAARPPAAAAPLFLLALLLVIGVAQGSEYRAESQFDRGSARLSTTMQIKCPSGGEKIRIADVHYRIASCRAVEFRSDEAVSAANTRTIERCTGERLCVLREGDLASPFLAGKQGCLIGGQASTVVVIYKCVPQDRIRPLCSSFESMDAEGYLATQHYPMDMNSTEGKSPCVCDLRASSGGGRVRLTFVELQLGSESSHVDPAACQREHSKQYVQLRSSYGMSTAYYLCAHRYNVEPEPSQVYKIIFENPVASRRVGKLWIEYAVSNGDTDDMIKVTCYELQTTAMAAKKRPVAMPDMTVTDDDLSDSDDEATPDTSVLLAGLLAATVIVAAVVIVTAVCYWYKREVRKCLRRRRHSPPSTSPRQPSSASSTRDMREVMQFVPPRLLRSGAAAATAAALADGCDKPTALIVPTAKESDDDDDDDCHAADVDTDMDVKGYHPFETFMYTKPCRAAAAATPVQVEMPSSPSPPPLPPLSSSSSSSGGSCRTPLLLLQPPRTPSLRRTAAMAAASAAAAASASASRDDLGTCGSGAHGGECDRPSLRSVSSSSSSRGGDRDSSSGCSYFGTGSNVTTIRRGPPSPDRCISDDDFPPPPPPPPVHLESAALGAATP